MFSTGKKITFKFCIFFFLTFGDSFTKSVSCLPLHKMSSVTKHTKSNWLLNRTTTIYHANHQNTYSMKKKVACCLSSLLFFLSDARRERRETARCRLRNEILVFNLKRVTYVLCISRNEGHSGSTTADECSIVTPCTEKENRFICCEFLCVT